MAAFCVSCGTSLADGARFCTKCGASQPAAQAGAATAPTSAPPASKGSNTVVKILLWVLGFFVFMSLVAAGSCFYVGYRVKQRAHEFTKSIGGDAKPYTGKRQPCAMLSTSEASEALGQPVASVEQRGTTICAYTYGPGGSKSFDVDYTWEGGGITMGLTHGAMKQVAGMDTFTKVEDIGDETYMAPGNSALMMRKGDVMVNIDLREGGISAEAAQKMARKIAGRL
jgi:hypothetical protein